MLKKASKKITSVSPAQKLLLTLALTILVIVSVIPRVPHKSRPLAVTHQGSTVLQPTPKPAVKSAPATPPPSVTKTTTHKTTAKKTIVAKAQPAVTPSPAASVSGLAPVAPSGGSGGQGSGSGGGSVAVGYTSTNWSGYLTTAGSFTKVLGSWIVPTALPIGSVASADSTWVGIGGVTSGDLIQTGTVNLINSSGQVTTQAWYETLPQASIPISSLTVKPGDSMTASVEETATNVWLVTITDDSTGQSFNITLNYTSTHSSAEWIEEDPSSSFRHLIPLDNFQTAHFTTGQAVSSGTSESLANASALPVTLVDRTNQTIGLPSVLSGSSFTVTRQGI